MKKIFVLLSLALIATPAFAMNEGKYSCTVFPIGTDKNKVIIDFEFKNNDVTCAKGEQDECEEWFKYTPENQNKFWLDGLVDGGFEDAANGDWEVFADSDGCNVAHLTLYKNSNFTKGFITTEFRCGSGETERNAGKVSCTIK